MKDTAIQQSTPQRPRCRDQVEMRWKGWGPGVCIPCSQRLGKNGQRSIKVHQERQLHNILNPQLTLPIVSLAPCIRSSLMTSHTNHGEPWALCKERSPMLNQPHPVLFPSCQSLLWIPTFPLFSWPYFPYFSHVCSDLPAPSTVHLLSVFLLFLSLFFPYPQILVRGCQIPASLV